MHYRGVVGLARSVRKAVDVDRPLSKTLCGDNWHRQAGARPDRCGRRSPDFHDQGHLVERVEAGLDRASRLVGPSGWRKLS